MKRNKADLYKAHLFNNILYILVDIMESRLMDMEHLMRKNNLMLRYDTKRNFNTVMSAIRKLKIDVNKCSNKEQDRFGDSSDILDALIMTIVDRTGLDVEDSFKIYEHIKKLPSKMGLNMDMDFAFEHLIKQEEQWQDSKESMEIQAENTAG